MEHQEPASTPGKTHKFTQGCAEMRCLALRLPPASSEAYTKQPCSYLQLHDQVEVGCALVDIFQSHDVLMLYSAKIVTGQKQSWQGKILKTQQLSCFYRECKFTELFCGQSMQHRIVDAPASFLQSTFCPSSKPSVFEQLPSRHQGYYLNCKSINSGSPFPACLLPNLLHFPGWDSVAVVGLQTQQENERRNAPTLLVGTSICICFKKTYLFLCISLALEPHLGKGYLFHFALHHVYILTFSTLLFHSPSCCPL